jgi:hypothetical protein
MSHLSNFKDLIDTLHELDDIWEIKKKDMMAIHFLLSKLPAECNALELPLRIVSKCQ